MGILPHVLSLRASFTQLANRTLLMLAELKHKLLKRRAWKLKYSQSCYMTCKIIFRLLPSSMAAPALSADAVLATQTTLLLVACAAVLRLMKAGATSRYCLKQDAMS